MKILFTADQHLTLRKGKVDKIWAKNRYYEFFKLLNEIDHDIIILGGDWFDKSPNVDELALFFNFIKTHNKPIYMIAGNHEATTKYKTFLSALKPLESDNFKLMLDQEDLYFEHESLSISFFTYHYIKYNIEPTINKKAHKKMLISHARGRLPFIDAEYDFGRFSEYDLVLLGDLHTYHQHLPYKNVWYPGAPYSITFEQNNDQKDFGVFIVDTALEKWTTPKFIKLDLPQLIKKVVTPETAKQQLKQQSKHCYLYEIQGSVDELAKIDANTNINKKVNITNTPTIDLIGKTRIEEITAVLNYMQVKDKDKYIKMYQQYSEE